jgi:hypothetical protein
MEWIEEEVEISAVEGLLTSGYEVEVDSPDGWVGVNFYIHKGDFEEYVLECETGEQVSCNEAHLFETYSGWVSAKDLVDTPPFLVLTSHGFVRSKVQKSGKTIPIVDINVNHPNHRYYTNGVSSHNTGVGKSLFMCHHAAHCLSIGKNVLYITCEMAEERIAERIDANLLDTTIDDLQQFPKDVYKKKIERLREKTKGKLIIKEYPPCAAGANHFRILLEELRLKKNFKPDIIFIDYLNICASSRLKMNGTINSYLYVKAIAEELRGLAVEFSVPVFSATQVNRQGFGSSDFGLENTSESFGLPATADLMFALISTEELEALNQIQVKQLKNRYNSIVDNKRFVIGINRAKMKLFDVEASAQADIIQSEPRKPTEYKAFNRNGMQTRKFGDSDSKFKGWKL